MNQLCHFIVKFRKMIGIIFLLLTLISIYLMSKVVINYDLSSYIPDDMPSKVALNTAKEEFGMQSTGRIMIENVTLPEAKEYKKKIEEVEGVYRVIWISDDVDVYKPLDFIDDEDIVDYYKDNCTLFDIMFDEDDYSDLTYNAVKNIEEIIPDNACFIGSAVDTKNSIDSLQSEMITIMAFLLPLTIIILILTTDSFFSCLIFITVISISIIFNLGTNVIFKDVSFVTYSISAALQFAVSMDYSVFMLHQFEEQKKKYENPEEAMKQAVKNSFLSVFSSSLTTIAGFVALTFMSFGLGKDIGLVFAKGIIFSLICVLFLMPYLILTFEKRIEKTKHKRLLPSFDKFARATQKIGPLIIALSFIIIIPCFVAQRHNDFFYGSASFGSGPGSKTYEDEQKIIKKFGRSNPILLIVPNIDYYTEKQVVEEYENLEIVDKVLTLVNTVPEGVPYDFVDQDLYNKFQNDKYTRIVVYVKTSSESDLATKALEEVKDITKKYYGDDFQYTGTIPVTLDMHVSIEADYKIVNLISILAILIILIFTFRSLLVPIILTIVIESGIFINMAIPYFQNETMNFVGYLIVSSVELGATIDYAILLTNNYIKFRKSYNKKMAAITTVKESLPSILISGTILVSAGYIIRFQSSLKAVSDMGELIGRGALLSMILVVTVLPQFLVLFDKIITKKLDTIEKTSNKIDEKAEIKGKDKKKDRKSKKNKNSKRDSKEKKGSENDEDK